MFLEFQRFSASDIRIHFSTKMDVYLQLPPGHVDGLTRSIISCHHPWDERTCDAWQLPQQLSDSTDTDPALSHHKVPPPHTSPTILINWFLIKRGVSSYYLTSADPLYYTTNRSRVDLEYWNVLVRPLAVFLITFFEQKVWYLECVVHHEGF